ncbi:hypothetical protein MCOR07_010623 [Pyricularia oryzae]|uniref:Uncharacterized protein n=1 Tax=Pyricularia oryzae TaxID=318829 RepID=A0A4P7NPZ9_PYROR|nr:hypothetical protein MCOR17_010684 [Pyricularia oryzae]KAI6493468.1 hypothetical protein MCOR13_007765 [Pyricularia oryzae]KAI6610900.1 hypothetical protein MCOR07_010623 [Pyricularia oryzae]QBZ64252.1 hypothetical protein PoMZ_05947 [Pyricularia oryzae]
MLRSYQSPSQTTLAITLIAGSRPLTERVGFFAFFHFKGVLTTMQPVLVVSSHSGVPPSINIGHRLTHATHISDVSGSREYLNHRADEYTYMQIVYAIAFALMQIPSNASSSKPAR